MAAAVFALEVVSVGVMYYTALMPCMIASLVASGFAAGMGVTPETFHVVDIPKLTIETGLKMGAIAVGCAVISIVFCMVLNGVAGVYGRWFKNPYVRVVVGSCLVIGITLLLGTSDYMGAGAELIEKAAAVPGIERIRLGSLDPDMLHDEDIRRMAAVKKLCPQFHLSLQSGCDKTLRAMRRPYTTAQYAEIADKLREAFGAENVSFTTDVIVGFPGETEEDFEASMAFVTGMRFLKVHVFPYSRREGTAAYDFPDQLPEHEKEARSRRMTAAVEEVRAAEVCAVQGRTASVLLETPLSATMFTGYTRQYLPVLVNAPGCRTGDIVEVTLGEWDGKRCRAAIV